MTAELVAGASQLRLISLYSLRPEQLRTDKYEEWNINLGKS